MQDETRRFLLESAAAAASSSNVPSVSSLLATLSSQRRSLSAQEILRDSSILGTLSEPNTTLFGSLPTQNASTISALTGALPRSSLASVTGYPSTSEVDSIMLARSIAARRQLELKQALAQQQDVLMNEAYKRGREEALLSLLSFSGGENVPLERKPASESPVSLRKTESNDQATLAALGSNGIVNRCQKSSYFDASMLKDPDPVDLANRRARGGVTEPFPEKLHRMLTEVEEDETISKKIVSWFPHGRAFAIHNQTAFVADVMPKYFQQSRMSSFQRQLNLYGFTRITSGPDVGGYYHELFLKGRPNLSVHMRRVGASNAPKKKQNKSGGRDPDFYAMQPIGNAGTKGK